MRFSNLSDYLWGKNAKVIYLLIAALILLCTMLGSREIWTQEHRWADIVSAMFYNHDYLHPYLNDVPYYDKPLLSYWLIIIAAKILGKFSLVAMRLPSALAGMVAIWSIYRLGCHLKNKSLGLLSGWLLLTTFYFLFWARTSSADMLNMAGSLFAVSWYFDQKNTNTFFNYAVFFIVLALTALCKGLVGPIVTAIVIFPDLIAQHSWKKHINSRLFVSGIFGLGLYFLPFLISSWVGSAQYSESGLYLVYRENILRYFQPFDHKGPIYTYFIFLPIYLLPWAIFFLPALFSLKKRWAFMTTESKWIVWALLLLFLFFSLSGSRRNYYALPMVPFAILLTADWLLDRGKQAILVGHTVLVSFILLSFNFLVFQPMYYANGLKKFAHQVKYTANEIKPWSEWNVVMLDPESKIRFYLQLAPHIKNYPLEGLKRAKPNKQTLLTTWPVLQSPPKNTIFISRKVYAPVLHSILISHRMIQAQASKIQQFLQTNEENMPIAFIPV